MDRKQYIAWLAEYDFIGVANRKEHKQQQQRKAEAIAQKHHKTMETKVCKTCGRALPVTEFSTCVLSADKLQPSCKKCTSERQKKGWAKRAAKLCATQEHEQPQPTPEPERIKPTVKPEALKARLEKKNKAQQAEVEACTIGNIPDWILSAELRRRGYVVKVYKECVL